MTDTKDAARILDGLPEYLQGKGFISHTEAAAITALRAENAALRKQLAEAEARGMQVKPLVNPGAALILAKEMQAIIAADRWKGRALTSTPPEKWSHLRPETQQFWTDTATRILSRLIDAPSDEYTRGRIAGLKEAASKALSALWPILGGNQLDAETWQDISDAFSVALIAQAEKGEQE